MSRERIVDLVFSGKERDGRKHLIISISAALFIYGSATVFVIGPGFFNSSTPLPEAGPDIPIQQLFEIESFEVPPQDSDMTETTEEEPELNDTVIPEPQEEEIINEPEPEIDPMPLQTVQDEVEYDPDAPRELARAGSVLGVDADASDVLDLTGNTFVTGTGRVYSGGLTSSRGTSDEAVHGPVPTGPPPPLPPKPVKKEPDRSRPVGLSHSEWSCPWPIEADGVSTNKETVVIRVAVNIDGTVERAAILHDPGNGFGDAAKRCALNTVFSPALNSMGEPINAVSPPIRVRFVR